VLQARMSSELRRLREDRGDDRGFVGKEMIEKSKRGICRTRSPGL